MTEVGKGVLGLEEGFFVFGVRSNMGTVEIALTKAVFTQGPLGSRKADILKERFDGIGVF